MEDKIILNRLEKSNTGTGVTWGVPWKQGVLKDSSKLILNDRSGNNIPLQSWPLAYWPDGSLKWTAHAASFSDVVKERYYLQKGRTNKNNKDTKDIKIENKADGITINTGKLKCLINKKGSFIFNYLSNKNGKVCSGGRLECVCQERVENTYVDVKYYGEIYNVTIENSGPIRTTIKLEGKHKAIDGKRKWLPFILRLYFYANQESIKMVQTYIFDGDEKKDFIKSLGLIISIPLTNNFYNRHIRFVGDTGVFSESVRLLPAFRSNEYLDLYKKQIEGKYIKINKEHELYPYLNDMAVWNSYKLIQDSPDHYVIKKRTQPECSWVEAAHGNRSKGLTFVGTNNGGIAVGLKKFWEKYPSALELNDLSKDEGELKIWFWPPDSEIMDMRHYDTKTHIKSSYEGFEELRATPYGIANTNEVNLWLFSQTPSRDDLISLSEQSRNPQLLICTPEYYYQTKVFGKWSLPDKTSPVKSLLENILNKGIEFYKNEIEQRRWYGFWNYGDIMHSYDPVRHNWCYDMGGYAWQNSELVPNMWLWYSFLRTGRRDIFRLAESMTRHTSEVDIYHKGEYAGLGSRHNVIHWGCGCKEPRISMAGLHRFYYYLTADERVGEIMDEVKDADFATVNLKPMRGLISGNKYPTYIRSGPDWAAFCSNWLIQWERYQDTRYKEKIIKGIQSLNDMPYRFCSGPTFGYNPETGQLFYIGDENYSYHMVMPFGGLQIWLELIDLLEDNILEDMLTEFGEFYNLDKEEKYTRTLGNIKGNEWGNSLLSAGITAFSAHKLKNDKLAFKAWSLLLNDKPNLLLNILEPQESKGLEYIKTVEEIENITTNFISQWSLNIILALELIDEYLIGQKR